MISVKNFSNWLLTSMSQVNISCIDDTVPNGLLPFIGRFIESDCACESRLSSADTGNGKRLNSTSMKTIFEKTEICRVIMVIFY